MKTSKCYLSWKTKPTSTSHKYLLITTNEHLRSIMRPTRDQCVIGPAENKCLKVARERVKDDEPSKEREQSENNCAQQRDRISTEPIYSACWPQPTNNMGPASDFAIYGGAEIRVCRSWLGRTQANCSKYCNNTTFIKCITITINYFVFAVNFLINWSILYSCCHFVSISYICIWWKNSANPI